MMIGENPSGSDRYQMEPFCLFCHKQTDEIVQYNYTGVQLDKKSFPIPSHVRCYRKKIFLIWSSAGFAFIGTSVTFMYAMSALFLSAPRFSKIPLWVWGVGLFLAFIATAWVGVKSFIRFEDRIADYKRTHTDNEDYYKSDRLPWRR